MEKYILPLSESFNLKQIEYIVKKNYNVRVKGLGAHKREVKNEPYLVQIRKRYPWLSKFYNIYKWTNGASLHIDPGRNCCINIPITISDNETIMYEKIVESPNRIHNKYFHNVDRNTVEERFRFVLNKPLLFNTSVPHEVIGNDQLRVTFSWSVRKEFRYEDIVKILKYKN